MFSFLKLILLVHALALMPRYITQQQADGYLGVHVRTVRNKISEGVLVGYRLPGLRAVRVDLDEIQSKMQAMPTALKRRQGPVFGPRAKIITVVEAYQPPANGNAAPEAQDADQDQTEASEEVAR